MFKIIGQLFGKQWDRLTNYSGTQRLSTFALILLFGLDLFVLGMLFNGMQDVSGRIPTPQSGISSECENMTEGFQKLNPRERADRLKIYFTAQSADDLERKLGIYERQPLIPLCEQLHEKLFSYVGNRPLGDVFRQSDQVREKISTVQSEINSLKASYDSALLEKIAGQKREVSILPAEAGKIKERIAQNENELENLHAQENRLEQSIEQHALIGEYTSFIEKSPYVADFAKERERYARLAYWYPVKVLLAEIAFLLPLLLLAVVWNARVLKSQNNSQVLISSHLILVCLVPIFSRIVYFFYELLPHQLISELIDWLNQLNLGFIWRYVAIIGGIAVCLAVIVVAQKTVFSPARTRAIRLRKLLCRACGEKLHSVEQTCCEFCGTRQTVDCPHCLKTHRSLANFCRHCGGANTAPVSLRPDSRA